MSRVLTQALRPRDILTEFLAFLDGVENPPAQSLAAASALTVHVTPVHSLLPVNEYSYEEDENVDASAPNPWEFSEYTAKEIADHLTRGGMYVQDGLISMIPEPKQYDVRVELQKIYARRKMGLSDEEMEAEARFRQNNPPPTDGRGSSAAPNHSMASFATGSGGGARRQWGPGSIFNSDSKVPEHWIATAAAAAGGGGSSSVSVTASNEAILAKMRKGPLLTAIESEPYNHEKCVQLMTEVDLTRTDESGNTALTLACIYGRERLALLLIDQLRVEIGSRNIFGSTPLHAAAENGMLKTVKKLLEKGAEVNAVDLRGSTPLHFAAENGHSEIVSLLVQRGANINAMDSKGDTALVRALNNSQTAVVAILRGSSSREMNATASAEPPRRTSRRRKRKSSRKTRKNTH